MRINYRVENRGRCTLWAENQSKRMQSTKNAERALSHFSREKIELRSERESACCVWRVCNRLHSRARHKIYQASAKHRFAGCERMKIMRVWILIGRSGNLYSDTTAIKLCSRQGELHFNFVYLGALLRGKIGKLGGNLVHRSTAFHKSAQLDVFIPCIAFESCEKLQHGNT